MAKGTKLASGYIELDIEYTDALKKITKDLTDLEKASKKAGDEIGKNLAKGADDTAKSIEAAKKSTKDLGDEITKTNKKVSDSTKAITEFDDTLTKSKKTASEVGDELDKGVQKGSKNAGKTVEKEISAASKRASQSIADQIVEGALKASQDGGKALSDALVNAAGEGGKALGDMVGNSRVGHWIQDASSSVQDFRDKYITPAVDGVRSLADSFKAFQERDAVGVFDGLSSAFTAIGQSGAADALGKAGDKAAQVQDDFLAIKDNVKGTTDGLMELSGKSGKISSSLEAIGAAAGPIGLTVVAAKELDSALTSLGVAKYAEVPGSALWFMHQLANGWSGVKEILGATPFGSADPTKGVQPPENVHVNPGVAEIPTLGSTPAVEPGYVATNSGVPTAPTNPVDVLAPPDLPKRARGGPIKGPGTGTSDSIIGIDANGVPTARVSTGEGIVTAEAMKNGGGAVVEALNSGNLPGFDDGTGAAGVPAPMPVQPPEIKVPEANTGRAGDFNQWLSQQQGKAYQYGTLYDCSGFMSQVYNRLTGKQMPRFNTESDLASYGFVRGSKPGTFQLGIHHGGGGPNSHMAGTLPDGRSVESSSNGVQIGPGAHGAHDKQFEDHWFLPGSEGMGGASPAIPGGQADSPVTMSQPGDPAGKDIRTQGYIPAGAGGGGAAGSSLFSGAAQMGAQAINGLIDQAASAAATAASAAATAGSFGAGGEAGGAAASFAIGLGAQAAKRGVQYGAQMIGILGDAATEILMPFGVPRFFQTDPSQFMPQLPGQSTGVTTGEKAQQSQDNPEAANQPGMNPSGPVQPGQLPGQQPVGSPAQIATPGTGDFTPAPIGTPGLAQTQPQPQVAPPENAGPMPKAPAPAAPPPPKPPQPQQPPKPPTPLDFVPLDMPGVYDDGGWLMPGKTAINKSNAPEPMAVFTPEQWGALGSIAKGATMKPDPTQGASYDYRTVIENVTVKDVNELMNEADSRARLQMMRHAGRP